MGPRSLLTLFLLLVLYWLAIKFCFPGGADARPLPSFPDEETRGNSSLRAGAQDELRTAYAAYFISFLILISASFVVYFHPRAFRMYFCCTLLLLLYAMGMWILYIQDNLVVPVPPRFYFPGGADARPLPSFPEETVDNSSLRAGAQDELRTASDAYCISSLILVFAALLVYFYPGAFRMYFCFALLLLLLYGCCMWVLYVHDNLLVPLPPRFPEV